MYAALSACSLVFLERTSIQTKFCIFNEFVALRTELLFRVVLSFAVDVNHGFDGFLLTLYPWMFNISHLSIPTSGLSRFDDTPAFVSVLTVI
jgi:hypothetical protein